jgi:hypothetical protein
VIEYNGQRKTVVQWGRELAHLGITDKVIFSRLNMGWSEERALSENVHETSRLITFRGETRSLTAWATSVGIKPHTLLHRLDVGWPLERALLMSHQNKRMIAFGGREMSLIEWARELGITETCVLGRLDRGWSIERALTEPAKLTNTRKKKLEKQKH